MSKYKYIKPTISLASLSANPVAASNCSTSTADAKEIENLLLSMGYDDLSTAFGMVEDCSEPIVIDDYCKFSSSIQVFYS